MNRNEWDGRDGGYGGHGGGHGWSSRGGSDRRRERRTLECGTERGRRRGLLYHRNGRRRRDIRINIIRTRSGRRGRHRRESHGSLVLGEPPEGCARIRANWRRLREEVVLTIVCIWDGYGRWEGNFPVTVACGDLMGARVVSVCRKVGMYCVGERRIDGMGRWIERLLLIVILQRRGEAWCGCPLRWRHYIGRTVRKWIDRVVTRVGRVRGLHARVCLKRLRLGGRNCLPIVHVECLQVWREHETQRDIYGGLCRHLKGRLSVWIGIASTKGWCVRVLIDIRMMFLDAVLHGEVRGGEILL